MPDFPTGHLVSADDFNNMMPVGVVLPYGGSSAPTDWLLCDGASYLRADYPDLFDKIGTTFGSADGTHFNVPDMRGRVPVGYAASGGHTDVSAIGNNDGVAAANRRPKHNASFSLSVSNASALVSGASIVRGTGTGDGPSTVSETVTGTIGPAGTNPVDTPAYLVLNYIIRA